MNVGGPENVRCGPSTFFRKHATRFTGIRPEELECCLKESNRELDFLLKWWFVKTQQDDASRWRRFASDTSMFSYVSNVRRSYVQFPTYRFVGIRKPQSPQNHQRGQTWHRHMIEIRGTNAASTFASDQHLPENMIYKSEYFLRRFVLAL